MEIVNSNLFLATILFLCGSCNGQADKKESRQFYQAFEVDSLVYTIEADFMNELTFFSIYTKKREKIFEKQIQSAPTIDSIIGENIYFLKHLSVPDKEKKAIEFICKIDTINIEYNKFRIITKYTCANNEGREETKKWRFLKIEKNIAYFFDAEEKREYTVSVNKIVNRYNTLTRLGTYGYNSIIYSRDSNDVKKYFDSFFK